MNLAFPAARPGGLVWQLDKRVLRLGRRVPWHMQQPRDLGFLCLMSGCDTAHPSCCKPGLAGCPGGWQWGLVPVGMALEHTERAGIHRHSSGTVSNF